MQHFTQLATREAQNWLLDSLRWFFVAALFGVVTALPFAVELLDWDISWFSVGRVLLAKEAVLVYGGAFSGILALILYLIRPCATNAAPWMRLFRWAWHVLVGVGVLGILWGDSSGVRIMPFAWWIWPGLLLVLLGIAYFASGTRSTRPGAWVHVPLLFVLVLLVGSLASSWAFGLEGMMGVYTARHVQYAFFLATIVIVLTGFAHITHWYFSWSWRVVSVVLCLGSLASAPFLGAADLIDMPVAWSLVQHAAFVVYGVFAGLLLVCLVAVYWIRRAGREQEWTLKQRTIFYTSLGGFVLGMVVIMLQPLGLVSEQFSLSEWYRTDVAVMLTLGSLGITTWVKNNTLASYNTWLLWSIGLVLLLLCWIGGVVVQSDALTMPIEDQIRVMSTGVRALSWINLVAWSWIGCACLLWLSYRFRHGVVEVDYAVVQTQEFSHKQAVIFGVVLVLLVGVIGSYISLPEPSKWVTKRPGSSLEGSKIFAAEGCSLCHTQMIRRLRDGSDIQMQVDLVADPTLEYRPTDPEDFNRLSGEGAPHVGTARIGPDLSMLMSRVEQYVRYTDKNGETKVTATPREWLMLHLFNPMLQEFNKPWTVCPAMSGLFTMRERKGSKQSPEALPIKCPPGFEIVPSPRANQLVEYLTTLKRGEITAIDDKDAHLPRPTSYINPIYLASPPQINTAKLQDARQILSLERGRQVYVAKCLICHGKEGKGDQLNYPPLAGSEWVRERPLPELVGIIQRGLTGKIRVLGKEWNSAMPAPGVHSPRDIHLLVNYLKHQFAIDSTKRLNDGTEQTPPAAITLPEIESAMQQANPSPDAAHAISP